MKSKYSMYMILLSSVLLGFLLVSQITTVKTVPMEILTFQNYQQVSSEIRKLRDEISILDEKKGELELELMHYQNTGQSDSQIIQKLSDEIKKYEYYSGLTDVEGPGVVVTIEDNPVEGYNVPYDIAISGLIHDQYLWELVQDLINAGAEAISVKDERVVSGTEFYCEGALIRINNTGYAPPYTIKAIGDPETLAFALNDENGTYKELENDGLIVGFRKEDSIRINKYDGSIYSSYMKLSQNNK